jgi:protein phosphatase
MSQIQTAHTRVETGAATHVGKVRQRNEDSYLVRPEAGIWAVADGMGGHEAGDLASQTVIDALASIETQNSADELLSLCKSRIFDANSQLMTISHERGIIIGTTVTILLTFDGYFACVWSGDSRMYVVRDGGISQISRDHTELEDLLADGVITPEEAQSWTGKNVITRAIGVTEFPELEVATGTIQPGDVFIICTDGLTSHVHDDEILESTRTSAPEQACDRLVRLTLERGAGDNVTVVVVRFGTEHALASALQTDPSGLRGSA